MDYNYLREDSDFHKWHKYAPLDTQYIKYAESNPSVIAVGHKLMMFIRLMQMQGLRLCLQNLTILEIFQVQLN